MEETNKTEKQNGIATRLRLLRAEANKSQFQVANAIGLSQQTYSKYENQDTNIDSATIIKLCDYYGVTSDYLLGIETKIDRKENNISCVLQLTDAQVELLAIEMTKAKENK